MKWSNGSAYIEGDYRYVLTREWEPEPRLLCVCMLNPSTADDSVDDPTVRSVCRIARSHGYGGVWVVNLFAWRATDPRGLLGSDDPVGPRNDDHLDAVFRLVKDAWFAWGANGTRHRERAVSVCRIAREHGIRVHVAGWTKGGEPLHPLYLPNGTALVPATIDPDGSLVQRP